MRRLASASLLAVFLLATVVILATRPTEGYSDGMAGGTGAVPEHLKKCQGGVQYCTVTMPGCGSCHGDRDAMKAQRPTGANEPPNMPVVDRIQLTIKIGGSVSFREYEPGQSYIVDLAISTDRPRGEYASGGFNLNVSGGQLSRLANDDTVRITGGMFQHQGSQNPSYTIEGQPVGAHEEDETSWAGEATHTRAGSDQRSWRLKWVAPGKMEPHGVAFQASFMVPNGNGQDDACVYNRDGQGACDPNLGYSDQNSWDWWYFGTPLKIVCEKGQDFQECNENVLASIRPPAPPRNTCPGGATSCPAAEETGEDGGDGTPVPAHLVFLSILVAGAWWARHRPR